MMTKSLGIGLFIAAACAGYFLLWKETKVQAVSVPLPRTMPEFHLRDIQDRPVSSEDFRGMPAIIQIWATWCDYCRDQLRDMMALQLDMGGRVKFIAIDRGEAAGAVIPYWYGLHGSLVPKPAVAVETGQMTGVSVETVPWETVQPPALEPKPEMGVWFLLDPKDSIYPQLDGFAMPETILAGPDGVIRDHIRGPVSKQELRRRIEQTFGL